MRDFQTIYISSATTTNIETNGRQIRIGTVCCPKALAGTATFQDKDGAAYFVLPIGSINTQIINGIFPNGLSVVTSAGDTLLVNVAKGGC